MSGHIRILLSLISFLFLDYRKLYIPTYLYRYGDTIMRMKKGLLHSEFFDLEYVVDLCKKEK